MIVSGVAACLLISGTTTLATEPARVATNAPVVAPAEHPLAPVLRWAEQARPGIAAIRDYTATLQKQERIDGRLMPSQILEVKVRHEPFSVHTRFIFPENVAGQQAIFVEGRNNGNLLGRGVGVEALLGWVPLDPDGPIAMRGQKYPITQIGVLNLVDELLKVGREAIRIEGAGTEVLYFENQTLGTGDSARQVTEIRVINPVRRPGLTFHVARIFVDNELNLPIRYQAFDWPSAPGETPQLIEIYHYGDLKTNVGLTDADFDSSNPRYNNRR